MTTEQGYALLHGSEPVVPSTEKSTEEVARWFERFKAGGVPAAELARVLGYEPPPAVRGPVKWVIEVDHSDPERVHVELRKYVGGELSVTYKAPSAGGTFLDVLAILDGEEPELKPCAHVLGARYSVMFPRGRGSR